MSTLHQLDGTDVNDFSMLHSLDIITGTPGDTDPILGTQGDDEIIGTAGADTIDGEDGDDVILGNGGGDDLHGGGGADVLIAEGDDNNREFGDDGADKILGGNGGDEEHGGADNDLLIGDAGVGPGGNDNMFGDDGADTLNGGGGNDLLTGGTGNDTLTGGEGDDTFIFNTNEGPENDTITDFQSGQDTVQLDGVGADFVVADHLTQTDAGAVLTYADGQTILFAGETVDQIHQTDFHLS